MKVYFAKSVKIAVVILREILYYHFWTYVIVIA